MAVFLRHLFGQRTFRELQDRDVSEVRCELAAKLHIDRLQQIFYQHWSPYMKDRHSLTTDATCYESHLRYPTNVKLLWECVEWLYGK